MNDEDFEPQAAESEVTAPVEPEPEDHFSWEAEPPSLLDFGCEPIEGDDEDLAAWKEDLRRDFEAWLAAVGELPDTAGEPDPLEQPDLFSFFEQLAVANAESRKSNRRMADAFSQWGETLGRFDSDLRLLREQIGRLPSPATRDDAQERGRFLALVELLDRLRRLARAFQSAPGRRWWEGKDTALRQAWESQQRGFEILVGHFEALLAGETVLPLPSAGQPFDPATMAAVETAADPARPDNIVLEEIAPGYTFRGALLRSAQVKVNVLDSDGNAAGGADRSARILADAPGQGGSEKKGVFE